MTLESGLLFCYFNPRSLAGATLRATLLKSSMVFQSTLPRGSDAGLLSSSFLSAISIHAPSRERQTLYKRDLQLFIFQSTLPRGSDATRTIKNSSRLEDFNPRSLAGATHNPDNGRGRHAHFNPRSLAGATDSVVESEVNTFYFNPRSLAGATTVPTQVVTDSSKFQSTLPRGSDESPYWSHVYAYPISIHAPSRERPCLLYGASYIQANFNPRSLAGATSDS